MKTNVVDFETAELLWKLKFTDKNLAYFAYLPLDKSLVENNEENIGNKVAYLAPDTLTAIDFLWEKGYVFITYIWDNVGNCIPSMKFMESGKTYMPVGLQFKSPTEALKHCLSTFVGMKTGKISSDFM